MLEGLDNAAVIIVVASSASCGASSATATPDSIFAMLAVSCWATKKNLARCDNATNPSVTNVNAIQPACEWKPSLAIRGDMDVPMTTNVAIRRTFVSQIDRSTSGNNIRLRGNDRSSLYIHR